MQWSRREMLSAGSLLTVGAALGHHTAEGMAKPSQPKHWPIGCFNRPWTKWPFDEALKGVKGAGYKITGMLSRTKSEAFIASEATPEYLQALKKKISASGLTANMAALRSRHDIPLEDSIREVRKQIDNARFLKLHYLLTFGVDKAEHYDHYYRVMADAAAYAHEHKIRLVMKPHGGSSGASEEILQGLKKVGHPNFKIWYDAGNIIYYTGKDPIEELKPIVEYVTGFCAKDCAQPKGEVMIQFGSGKVDFRGVFGVLKSAGFQGPIMMECCALADSPGIVTDNARANREFLEKVLASL